MTSATEATSCARPAPQVSQERPRQARGGLPLLRLALGIAAPMHEAALEIDPATRSVRVVLQAEDRGLARAGVESDEDEPSQMLRVRIAPTPPNTDFAFQFRRGLCMPEPKDMNTSSCLSVQTKT